MLSCFGAKFGVSKIELKIVFELVLITWILWIVLNNSQLLETNQFVLVRQNWRCFQLVFLHTVSSRAISQTSKQSYDFPRKFASKKILRKLLQKKLKNRWVKKLVYWSKGINFLYIFLKVSNSIQLFVQHEELPAHVFFLTVFLGRERIWLILLTKALDVEKGSSIMNDVKWRQNFDV